MKSPEKDDTDTPRPGRAQDQTQRKRRRRHIWACIITWSSAPEYFWWRLWSCAPPGRGGCYRLCSGGFTTG